VNLEIKRSKNLQAFHSTPLPLSTSYEEVTIPSDTTLSPCEKIQLLERNLKDKGLLIVISEEGTLLTVCLGFDVEAEVNSQLQTRAGSNCDFNQAQFQVPTAADSGLSFLTVLTNYF
jgi:hypothetical protein